MNEVLKSCPVCGNSEFSEFMNVRDHFLSGENFDIVFCRKCSFKFINPRPDGNSIGPYYQSENYISHDAGKTDLLSTIYKQVRKISIRSKYRLVRKFCPAGNLLDIGCGTGEFLAYCRDQGFTVKGMEPGEKARNFARTTHGIDVTENLDRLLESGQKFDGITMWHVLEHIHELNESIIKIKKLLAGGGTLVVAVPNANSPDAQHYAAWWAAYDVPRHLYHFTSDTIRQLFAKHGMQVRKIYPQRLDAYYVSLLSEKYRNGKSNYIKAVLRGFFSNFKAPRPGVGHSSQIFILRVENS
jgi:2-polyprenyl-3-methyl-5-hydroxy-6-metoxy-1,4-benzoquinol methylase